MTNKNVSASDIERTTDGKLVIRNAAVAHGLRVEGEQVFVDDPELIANIEQALEEGNNTNNFLC
ncbi:hypothetical protein [Deinococcus multiflagellatus]|uniref:Uncharacterized protein n=1 Tax=Deinococcus multiflagellatus TaxID=1656887 RepID=A0ABW1ZID8_9DEIO|nr:hypothetical protein [Deinococcus multiflagellatus]MBZ9713649.1 hypothetical protein [Deinococcus multiflagellatus]